MNIFIDTCIFLRIANSSSPDIKDLKTLKEIIGKKSKKTSSAYRLIITDQTYDEYYRNCDERFNTARNGLVNKAIIFEPPLGKKDEKHLSAKEKKLKKLIETSEKTIQASFEKMNAEELKSYENKAKVAREFIDDFFSSLSILEIPWELGHRANLRVLRGMKPLPNSQNEAKFRMGDAINWQFLLSEKNADEYALISNDTDFLNEKGKLHKTLADEWVRNKKPRIRTFIGISEFLQEEGYKPKSREVPKTPSSHSPAVVPGTLVVGSQPWKGWVVGSPTSGSIVVTPSVQGVGGTFAGGLSSTTISPWVIAGSGGTGATGGEGSIGATGYTGYTTISNGGSLIVGDAEKCPYCRAPKNMLTHQYTIATMTGYYEVYQCKTCLNTFQVKS